MTWFQKVSLIFSIPHPLPIPVHNPTILVGHGDPPTFRHISCTLFIVTPTPAELYCVRQNYSIEWHPRDGTIPTNITEAANHKSGLERAPLRNAIIEGVAYSPPGNERPSQMFPLGLIQ